MARAVHTVGSMPAVVIASQMVPMWARSRPWVPATRAAARRWVASGRGVDRRDGRTARVLNPFPELRGAGALARPLGEYLSTGDKELTPPDGGRWKSCTGSCTGRRRARRGSRRGTKWYTEGRRPTLGVPGEPWPRWASTAHWEARRTRQAAVTVRTSQPTREAIVARVTATWRPVA